MSHQYAFEITVLSEVPLKKVASGTLKFTIENEVATGTITLSDELKGTYSLTGTVAYDTISGANVQLQGETGTACVSPSFLVKQDQTSYKAYLGGILHVLNYDSEKWKPYVLQGSQTLDSSDVSFYQEA